ncbi:MAG: hypothetical protein IKE01_04465 [Clostridia bacterium]|nr:hypothetical protein [Clostridia bacterium]
MKNERKVREIIVIICSVVAITGATVYGHFTKEKADALGNGSAASSEEIANETDESPTWETATETTAKATTRRKSTTCATNGATNATTTTTVVEVKLEQNDEANRDDASKAKRNKSQPTSKSQNPIEKVSTQARESEVVAATTAAQTTVQTTAVAKVTETSTATTAMTTSAEETTAETSAEVEETTEFVWTGKKLNRVDGIVPAKETPSGYKETWYPWDLHGCLDLMGYSYDGYDEDCDDGVQRYNGYVMVASPDLNAHPKGSLIPTTLGMGIVVDYCPAGNLDIAVNSKW